MDNPFQSLHVLVVHRSHRLRSRIIKLLQKQGIQYLAEAEDGHAALQEIGRQSYATEIAIFDPMQTDAQGVGLIDIIAHSGKVRTAALLMKEAGDAEATLEAVLKERGLGFLGILEGRVGSPDIKEALLAYVQHSQSSASRRKLEAESSERSSGEIQAGLNERQFTAWFQPEIDVRNRTFSGFEALARWQHPIHGVIPPGDFIPAMERSGLIEPLADIVFQRALQVLAKWRENGHDLHLSVNFSPLSIQNPRFAERLIRLVDRMRLPPAAIAVEVSEAAVVEHVLMEPLQAISDFGLRLCVDNYATGDLSVAVCSEIGCKSIKLARSLVSDIHNQQDKQQQISQIVANTQLAGIRLHAEGVESADEWHTLEALGCQSVQGFLLGKPMDASQLNGWFNLYPDRIPKTNF